MRTAVCLLLTVVGCSAPIGNQALDVTIVLAPGVASRCVKVIVSAESGPTLSTAPMKVEGKTSLRVAVFRDELPASVTVQAQGYSDDACTARTVPVEESSRDAATFKSTLTKLTLTVERGSSVDADQDGASPPSDCNDLDPTVKPGAIELCSDGIDNDCNGDEDCADPACIDQSCGAGATCRQLSCRESNCADFADGDQDNLTDCADPDCAGLACGTGTGAACVGTACTELLCGDSSDNDLDTLKDCMETGCVDAGCGVLGTCMDDGGCWEPREGTCDDGSDNDGDTRIDCDDTDCNGLGCYDGDLCTQGETCASGQCRNGTAITCGGPVGQCFSTAGACAPDSGVCAYPPRAADAGCDDNDPCTVRDRCTGAGACASVPQTCAPPPSNGCFLAGVCQASLDGGCAYSVDLGALCSDGNNCTRGDSCGDDGGCQAGTQVTCTPPECKIFNPGSCDSSGMCLYADAPPNTPCSNGGRCNGSGACVPTPVFPYAPDNIAPAAHPPNVALETTINCALTFNSGPDAGFVSLCSGMQAPAISIAAGGAAGELAVISVNHFTITDAGSLTLTGSRPVVLLVWGDAGIDGPIFANSTARNGAIPERLGPGAGPAMTCGQRTGFDGLYVSGCTGSGGGGAGYRTAGARGGYCGNNAATVVDGGSAVDGGDTPLLVGCAGGKGGAQTASDRAPGGVGGGAVQISVAGVLRLNAAISSSGSGGLGAVSSGGSPDELGGGGGGSGGTVLLQAGRLWLLPSAILTANGGGGGGGSQGGSAGAGGDGPTNSDANAAGGSKDSGGGDGGGGASASNEPGAGVGAGKGGGGGGGATGKIFLKHIGGPGACSVDGSAVISPPPIRVNCPP